MEQVNRSEISHNYAIISMSVPTSLCRNIHVLHSIKIIFFQEVIYEEVRVKGRECSPDAVTLDSLLGCGSFHEVYTGTVTKLEGVKLGTRVMVGRSKGQYVSNMFLKDMGLFIVQ